MRSSVYETHHEHEYNAIRNAAALIDVTPLFKYMITGRDATRFVNRVIARDINKVAVDQVIYCCWCDEDGKIIDDGTITRLEENRYRWTAADPNLRWFRQNAIGLDVQIEDITEQIAALALQGPTAGKLLKSRRRSRHRQSQVLSQDQREDRRRRGGHFAHRLHGRSRLRDLDAVARRGESLGCADGRRAPVRHSSHGHAGAGCCAHRSGIDPRRCGLRQQQEGADCIAEI